jgi:hypothetical protein
MLSQKPAGFQKSFSPLPLLTRQIGTNQRSKFRPRRVRPATLPSSSDAQAGLAIGNEHDISTFKSAGMAERLATRQRFGLNKIGQAKSPQRGAIVNNNLKQDRQEFRQRSQLADQSYVQHPLMYEGTSRLSTQTREPSHIRTEKNGSTKQSKRSTLLGTTKTSSSVLSQPQVSKRWKRKSLDPVQSDTDSDDYKRYLVNFSQGIVLST